MRLIHIILLVLFVCILQSCTVNFKGKDVEFESRPANPNLEFSDQSYELNDIELFSRRI